MLSAGPPAHLSPGPSPCTLLPLPSPCTPAAPPQSSAPGYRQLINTQRSSCPLIFAPRWIVALLFQKKPFDVPLCQAHTPVFVCTVWPPAYQPFFSLPFFNAILPVIHSTLHWIIHRLLPELLPTSQCRPLFSIYHHFPVKAQNSSAKSDSYLVYLALNQLGLFSLPGLLCSPKHFKHLNPKVHLLKSVLEQRGTSVNSYLRCIHTFPCLYLTFLPERKSLIFVAAERRCSSCSEDGEAARPGPSHSFSLWLQPVNFSCMHCVFSFNGFQMCLNTCKMTAQNAKNLITAYYIYFMSSAIVVLWCPGVFVWFYFGFARANTG